MSFVSGTLTEEIYSLPAAGGALTSTTKSVISANSATNPPCQLPAPLYPMWLLPDKTIRFLARGLISTTAAPGTLTMGLYEDPTQNSTTSQIQLAGSGALTPPVSLTNGMWELEVGMTYISVGVTGGAWTASVNVWGKLTFGPAANAATAAAVVYAVGANAITINPSTAYFQEIWAQWGTAPVGDSIQCNQFQVFGEN